MTFISHYNYLEENLQKFFEANGVNWQYNKGIIVAHGDKCESYKQKWLSADIPFPQGVAIYLIAYNAPFSAEVRDTKNGWVDPGQWVVDNASRFLPTLPEV